VHVMWALCPPTDVITAKKSWESPRNT